MRSRFALAISVFASLVVSVLTASTDASAHPGITGYSGKPYNGLSETCTTNCHAKGGAAPTLTITVPQTVQAGSTNGVTIVVAGNKVRTSMNAAFSDGVKTIKGTNTDTPLPMQEPTEVGAVVPPPNGATGTYQFSFIAPNVNGPITMWVAGMAANGSGTGGDGVANATRTITVTGADAGAGAGAAQDGGATDGGSGGSSGSSGGSGDGGSGGGSRDAGASHDSPQALPNDSPGCGCVAARMSRNGTRGLALVVVGSLVALARRRRR